MQTVVFPCNHDCRRRKKEQFPRAARRSGRYMPTMPTEMLMAARDTPLPLSTQRCGLWPCFLREALRWRIQPLPGSGDVRTDRVPSWPASPESAQWEPLQGRSPFPFLPIPPSFRHSFLSILLCKSFDLVNQSNEIFVKG